MPNSNAPAVMLRGDAFRELGRWHGMKSAQAWATRLGFTLSTVTRAINGDRSPSSDFIARVMAIFPDVPFETLFYVGDLGDAAAAPDGSPLEADEPVPV